MVEFRLVLVVGKTRSSVGELHEFGNIVSNGEDDCGDDVDAG